MPYKSIIINPPKYTDRHSATRTQFYRGFSTVDPSKDDSRLYDYELIKQDLLNQFNVRKGERVMNPDFGTVIWDSIFEPFTDQIKQEISDDVIRIVNADPRSLVLDITIIEQEHGMMLEITLQYNDTDQSEVLKLNFDKSAGLSVV
jgi:phage baseplate assembly protein W